GGQPRALDNEIWSAPAPTGRRRRESGWRVGRSLSTPTGAQLADRLLPISGSELRSRRERHAPSSGSLSCVNAIRIASPHPVPGRDPSRFGTRPSGGTRESHSGGPLPRTARTIAAALF